MSVRLGVGVAVILIMIGAAAVGRVVIDDAELFPALTGETETKDVHDEEEPESVTEDAGGLPPFLTGDQDLPPGLAERESLPPGLAKKQGDDIPPGLSRQEGEFVPPGLAMKGADWLPPGLAKQGKIPPGHAKRLGVNPATSGGDED